MKSNAKKKEFNWICLTPRICKRLIYESSLTDYSTAPRPFLAFATFGAFGQYPLENSIAYSYFSWDQWKRNPGRQFALGWTYPKDLGFYWGQKIKDRPI